MGRHAAPQRRSRTGRWLVRLRAVLAGGLVLGVGTSATLAAWTDNEYASATVTGGTFGIVGNATEPYVNTSFTDNPTGTPAALTLAYSTGTVFAPGTTATTRFSVRLATGSVPGTVTLQAPTLTGAASGANLALAQQMTYQVRVVSGTVAAPANPSCATVFANSQGTLLTPTTPPTFSGGTAPTFASQSLVQTTSPTIQHYCVQMALPTANATNASQGGSFTATFTFAGST